MDGVLVVDKPVGPTSHEVVALLRRLSGTRRVGHGGTLDPFARGVLPLFIGLATRLAEYHFADAKRYRATICFGATSTTDDLEGELTPSGFSGPDRAAVEGALTRFRGRIEQRPPDFSARRVAGRRAYELARRGQTPELRPREVTIDRLELAGWDDADRNRPVAEVDVECSAGTYVRALARDLGSTLGVGAYLGALTRTASGPFVLEAAHDLGRVREAAQGGQLAQLLLPVDAGLDHLPTVTLGPEDVAAIGQGQFIRPPAGLSSDAIGGAPIRVFDQEGRLIAVARFRAGRLVPDKVLVRPVSVPRTGEASGSAPVGSGEATVAQTRGNAVSGSGDHA